MASELHVDAIKHSGGTSALTIDSSGNVKISGHVVQVARTYTADASHINTSSTSLVASGFQCSITPKFSDSLILVDFNSTLADGNADTLQARMYLKIGSASIAAMPGADTYHLGFQNPSYNQYSPLCFGGSYTATSTDTLMFEPYIQSYGGGNVRLVHNNASLSLTVTEVAQ